MFGIGIYEVRRSENQTSQCHFHIRIHLKWSEVVAARQHIPFRMEEDRGRLGQIGGDGERVKNNYRHLYLSYLIL